MKYRVLKPLSTGERPGDVVDESELAPYAIESLINCNAISPVSYPPVDALPGWTRRGERFKELGIENLGQFLDADSEALAEELNYQPATIERWKKEADDAVTVSGDEATITGCQGCSGRK